MENLIPKDALLDAIEDDDDIDWNTDPVEYPDRVDRESAEELVALIQFAGLPALQEALRALCLEYSDIFATSVRHLPAKVQSMVLDIDNSKWEVPRNQLPQRSHVTEKQATIRSQIDSLLALGVIEESRASYWSQLHMVRKPTPGEWRMALNFVQLNAATQGLEGWPIPNIQQALARLGTLKPKLFGLLDFTAGCHQTPLDPASRAYTAFSAAGGLYQRTRVAMELNGSGPYFQCDLSNTV